MNKEFKIHKRAIRTFIRVHWDDQKLAEVWAFNRDGKMRYTDPCACLLGVTKSTVLHQRDKCTEEWYKAKLRWWQIWSTSISQHHYRYAENLTGALKAEEGYCDMQYPPVGPRSEALAARRLSAILRAEMRRRGTRPHGRHGPRSGGSTSMKAEWVIVQDGGASGECLRCGEKFSIKLPVQVDVWVAAALAFVKLHRRCTV